MTSDSYSNIVTKKNEIHIVRMDNGKEETRELRHPDEAEGWKEIRQWVMSPKPMQGYPTLVMLFCWLVLFCSQ